MSTTPLLIGLTGHKRAGKDTAAKIFAELIGGDVAILHFADALKDEVVRMFRIERGDLDNQEYKELRLPVLTFHRAMYYPRHEPHVYEFAAFVDKRCMHTLLPSDTFTPRSIMQLYGEWRRCQDKDYWAQRIADVIGGRMTCAHGPGRSSIIADVRYANETFFIYPDWGPPIKRHAALIRIENPQADTAAKADTHESEAGLAFPFATHTIHNTGDLAHLRAECERVLAEIRGEG